jgi:hypothetical protein
MSDQVVSGLIKRRPLFAKDFPMSSFVQPGKWYLAVDCAKCGEAIPFSEAPSPEDAQEVKFRTDIFYLLARLWPDQSGGRA